MLVDTCALIWFLREDPELSERAAAAIEDPDNEIFISVASIWEIAIKASLGKLEAPQGLATSLEKTLEAAGFQMLEIRFSHAAGVLALADVHRDPFDRILISQCLNEKLTPVTNDPSWRAPRYGLAVYW